MKDLFHQLQPVIDLSVAERQDRLTVFKRRKNCGSEYILKESLNFCYGSKYLETWLSVTNEKNWTTEKLHMIPKNFCRNFFHFLSKMHFPIKNMFNKYFATFRLQIFFSIESSNVKNIEKCRTTFSLGFLLVFLYYSQNILWVVMSNRE